MGGKERGAVIKESLARSRFVMRLNGFSSTLRRRDLWRASSLVSNKSKLHNLLTHLLPLDLVSYKRPYCLIFHDQKVVVVKMKLLASPDRP